MQEYKKWERKDVKENGTNTHDEVMALETSIIENFAKRFTIFKSKYFLEEDFCVEKVKGTKFQNCDFNYLRIDWMRNLK